MQEHELPDWNDIVDGALAELDNARTALSAARDWLRSDWRPLGSSLPGGAGERRLNTLELIGEAKGQIDKAKTALHDARKGTS